MSAPGVTVLIPSHDHAPFVVEAARSALGQTVRDLEVLVIDDGSRDDSVARLRRLSDPRLVVLTQANAGLSRTLNRGLERARGRWIKFLPSDDLLLPECLERQLAALEAAGPEAVVSFALPEIVDARGVPLADPGPQAWFDAPARDRVALLRALLERNFLCAPGALFARAGALAAGGFDASLAIAQDYDLWLKLLDRGEAVVQSERLVRVRWHGANQSALVTPSSEAERAFVVVQALLRSGLERWIELFREPSETPADDDARARLALAAALVRSGLRETWPFARRLVAEARGLDVTGRAAARAMADLASSAPTDLAPLLAVAPELVRPQGWAAAADATPSPAREAARLPGTAHVVGEPRRSAGKGIAGALRTLAARLGRPTRHARSADHALPAVAPGPRREHWVVVGAAAPDVADDARALRLAFALARAGATVTCAPRFAPAPHGAAAERSGAENPRLVAWDLRALREHTFARDERLRVLVQSPDSEAVALALEARRHGARILYDKVADWVDLPAGRFHPQTEQALIDAADDLIGRSRPLVKRLAASRRIVHLVPDGEDDRAWLARASSLGDIVARPTLTVAVSCDARHARREVGACLDALAALREDVPLRLVAVESGVTEDVLGELREREERDQLLLLGNARRGRASGLNLALRATASELVMLVDADCEIPASGWLAEGITWLLARRQVGALASPRSVTDGAARRTWLAPRAVLARTAGFDEAFDPGSFEDLDLERQLVALGYGVVAWSDVAGAPTPAPEPARPIGDPGRVAEGARHLDRKWRGKV